MKVKKNLVNRDSGREILKFEDGLKNATDVVERSKKNDNNKVWREV